jgi:hypothetical protein
VSRFVLFGVHHLLAIAVIAGLAWAVVWLVRRDLLRASTVRLVLSALLVALVALGLFALLALPFRRLRP